MLKDKIEKTNQLKKLKLTELIYQTCNLDHKTEITS
jgi:hypothetical protein